MPRCTPSSVWQALLTCEVVPTLAEVLRAWCWLSLVLTLLSPGVLPLAIFRAPQFWWDLRAFCLSQRTWVCSLISRFSMFSCCYVMFALVFLFFIFFPGCLLIHPGSAINQMISVLETYPPHGDAFPDLLDCSVGCALILGKGWHWRVVTLLSSARTLLRLLVDSARTHTRRWMPISIPSSVWQALLSPEVVPMLAEELPLASMSRSGQADVVCQWIKAFRIQPKEMGREAALGETGEVPLEAGDAPLALPLTSISSTFLFSPCHLALCNLPVLAKSKCSLMESNSGSTITHLVCPHTSWLRALQYCWMSVPSVAPCQHGGVLSF
eukprot:XP_024999794.1 uncharacterized protein LOC107050915 [Gallus gallus]